MNINHLNIMNNLIENYKIILNNLKATCTNIKSFRQIRTPKLSNLGLVVINLTAEFMSINIETLEKISGYFLKLTQFN